MVNNQAKPFASPPSAPARTADTPDMAFDFFHQMPVDLLRRTIREVPSEDVFKSLCLVNRGMRQAVEDAAREESALPPGVQGWMPVTAIALRFPLLQTLVLRQSRFSAGDMDAISRLTALSHLDLGSSVFDRGASSVQLPSGLQYLNLSGVNCGFADIVLPYRRDYLDLAPLASCSNLITLDISWREVRKRDWRHLRHLGSLRRLTAQGQDHNVQTASLPPQLEELIANAATCDDDFSHLTSLTMLAADELPTTLNHARLRHLATKKCHLGSVLTMTNLETLRLTRIHDEMPCLAPLSNLRALDIGHTYYDGNYVSSLTQLTALTVLAQDQSTFTCLTRLLDLCIVSCPGWGHDLPDLRKAVQLTSLALIGISVASQSALDAVADLPALQELRLTNVPTESHDLIARLARLSNLKILQLDCCSLRDGRPLDLANVSCLCNLECLQLSYYRPFNLSALWGLTALKDLHLVRCGLGCAQYGVLRDLTTLETLDVSQNPRPVLAAIAGITGLKHLCVRDCDLVPSDLEWLGSLRRLVSLDVCKNASLGSNTCAHVSHLSALPRLTHLKCDEPSSKAVSKALARARCGLQIIFHPL